MVSHEPPPSDRGGVEPDAIPPEGSEIRLLVDHRHDATRDSLVEVTLLGGQVWRCPAGAPIGRNPR